MMLQIPHTPYTPNNHIISEVGHASLLALVYVELDQWLQSSLQQQKNPTLDLVPAYHYTENIRTIIF